MENKCGIKIIIDKISFSFPSILFFFDDSKYNENLKHLFTKLLVECVISNDLDWNEMKNDAEYNSCCENSSLITYLIYFLLT